MKAGTASVVLFDFDFVIANDRDFLIKTKSSGAKTLRGRVEPAPADSPGGIIKILNR